MRRDLDQFRRLAAPLMLSSLLASSGASSAGGGVGELPKHIGGVEDTERLITDLEGRAKEYLDKGWPPERARAQAFKDWAGDHHSDFPRARSPREGPLHLAIQNLERPSRIGIVDIDWLATIGHHGLGGVTGSFGYVGGKEAWFGIRGLTRGDRPDRSSFFNTYPDTNWRALAARELLASGKVSARELFDPDSGADRREVAAKRERLDRFFATHSAS